MKIDHVAAGLAMIMVPAVASAQTQQWSTPTKTEQWSVPAAAPTPPPASPSPSTEAKSKKRNGKSSSRSTGQWAKPVTTRQVDPKSMDDPEPVLDQAAVPEAMIGTWNLWVPGGVWYTEDGSRIYRSFTPGAAMNRLTIAANGSYIWGGHQAPLREVKPWFALEGQRYFAVQMGPNLRYMARYDAAKDKIDLFFWGVGGHAASGTRG